MLRNDYPIAMICQVLGLARSTAYYQAHPRDDQPLRQAISDVAEQFPTYGTRRTAKQLGRAPHGLLVNRKRARRLMHELVTDRVAQAPDEIWVSEMVAAA